MAPPSFAPASSDDGDDNPFPLDNNNNNTNNTSSSHTIAPCERNSAIVNS